MADMPQNPTDFRISDPGIRALFTTESRWQAWLDVEAALAKAEADLGMIPAAAAEEIAGKAKIELGLAKGKKLHDKRETDKKRDWNREKARLMREKG